MTRLLELDPAALAHNVAQARDYAQGAKMLAMVKSNGYGHGLLWVAKHLVDAGVDALGIADMNEALLLRKTGFTLPLVLMNGFLNAKELETAYLADITLVVHEMYQLALLEQQQLGKRYKLWLKVDTGMHRLGFSSRDVVSAYHRLSSLPLAETITLMTHFSDADDPRKPETFEQINCFRKIHAQMPETKTSLANSAALMCCPEARSDWVRPGIMLYGASPFVDREKSRNLQPVMTVRSQVIAVHTFSTGTPIGYGGVYTCTRPSRIAVVAFGYGDGFPRNVQHAQVLIQGKRCDVIGRISMDLLTADVTDYPEIHEGAEVVLWGKEYPCELLAEAAGTIPYEIFCRFQSERFTIL